MGASLAFWLSRMGATGVTLVERDPGHACSATALSAASIRQQFSTPVNVAISRFGIEFLRNARELLGDPETPEQMGLVENGYLFLAVTDADARAMRASVAVQHAGGAGTVLLGPDELSRRFPWLASGGVRLASFGPRDEGWFDNMALLRGLRAAALRQGVRFLTDEVTGLARDGSRALLKHGGAMDAGAICLTAGTQTPRVASRAASELSGRAPQENGFRGRCPGCAAPGRTADRGARDLGASGRPALAGRRRSRQRSSGGRHRFRARSR